jgi:hypothetical protein
MAKKILTVELELAADDAIYAEFRSKMSLLDWDIILFRPRISQFLHNYYETYQGKPCLRDTASFDANECCEHWRREIKQAVDTGKTVIIFLPGLDEVYVDTGQRSYSGTGRNQKTTRHVALLTNYQAIPVSLGPVSAKGTSMKLASKGADVLSPFWNEFGEKFTYEVTLNAQAVPACIVTRSGERPVGAIYRSKTSSGTLLLLPDINFEHSSFTKGDEGQVWTEAGKRFGGSFVSTIVNLDKALKSSSEVTPEPSWATQPTFALEAETALKIQLLEAERQVELAQKLKEEALEALASAGDIRALLYEKGKPLEAVIIKALQIIGFQAASFKESDSEFDVVFECSEGRLIGEAEGKDSKAVNIDKLRQLSMNIHEDLLREEVSSPAKPVLFGNGYRLEEPSKRDDPFTEKCHSAAATASTALVATSDLFTCVQYLVGNEDENFASQCRTALLTTTGRVNFPLPPTSAAVPTEVKEGSNK